LHAAFSHSCLTLPSEWRLRLGQRPFNPQIRELPGAYNDNDPGIFDLQVRPIQLLIPGHYIYISSHLDVRRLSDIQLSRNPSFVSNADDTNSDTPSASSLSAKSTSTPKPYSASSNGTSGPCHLKKKPRPILQVEIRRPHTGRGISVGL
jgi:hypothetical protein